MRFSGILWPSANRGGVTERWPGSRDRQIRNGAGVGRKILLDCVRPELAHILQLLDEGGIEEDAVCRADHGLVVQLVSKADPGGEVEPVIPHQRRAEAAGVRRFTGHASDWIHFRIGRGPQQRTGVQSGLRIACHEQIAQPVGILNGRRNEFVAKADVHCQLVAHAPIILHIVFLHIDIRVGGGVAPAAPDIAGESEQHAGETISRSLDSRKGSSGADRNRWWRPSGSTYR